MRTVVVTGTHIGLTIYLLPNGPPAKRGLVGIHKATALDKFALLAKPASWNSLVSPAPKLCFPRTIEPH